MGETDEHRDEMVRHIELLKSQYRGQKAYASGNLLIYYEQGNPKKFVVPDAFVAKGVHNRKRRTYKIWVEGKAPDVIFETTSKKTKNKDTIDKPQLYSRLRVKEYFLTDPDQEYLDPPLIGYRLAGDAYMPIERDADGFLASEELGLVLRFEAGVLQFYRPGTGERLLTAEERAEQSDKRAAQSEKRAAQSDKRAAELEKRAAEAEAELARLRERLGEDL